MATKSLNGVLQHVRVLAAVQVGRALTDRELLQRFVEQKDEAAFTVLIERHGPMVLGVCQRSLRHFHDAEDACQATFLVFARKAGSIRKTASLGSWLHGVACRVAGNLKRQRARRQKRERQAAAPSAQSQDAAANWQDVQTVLDEELQLLPDRYRAPLLLCYWECKTRDEAAEQLGLSPGKLHGLLERGRTLLRERLSARGLTLSAALCASLLAAGTINAALAPTLVIASTKAALLLAAGEPLAPHLVSSQVLTLTREVLRSMLFTKLKIATASILCAGLVATLLGGSLATTGSAQNPPAKAKAAEPQAKGESDEAFIRRLSKDLRGGAPTPTEVHFFVTSKDAGKRQKLIDLFIQERQVKQSADKVRDFIHHLQTQTRILTDKIDKERKRDKKSEFDEARERLEMELIMIELKLRALDTKQAEADEKDKDRVWIYAPVSGTVKAIPPGLKPGSQVAKGQPLLVMFDAELERQVNELQTEIEILGAKINARAPKNLDPVALEEAKITHRKKIDMLKRLKERSNADLARPGFFTITAPRAGIILSADFRETLIGRNVRSGDPLIRIGYTDPNNPKLKD